MPDRAPGAALLRLMAWLSPAFPVGGFSYSHGLERAVHDGLVTDATSLSDWLHALLEMGSGWNDAVLFAESWRRGRDGGDLVELAELAEALAGSEERHRETMLQGTAFLVAAAAWPSQIISRLPDECPYCVAVGAAAGGVTDPSPISSDGAPPPLTPPLKGEGDFACGSSPSPLRGGVRGGGKSPSRINETGIPLPDALAAYLQAFLTNPVQAAIRLGVIGQIDATALIAKSEPTLLAVAARAAHSSLDDLGGCAFISDIMAMRHEVQYSRLFRS